MQSCCIALSSGSKEMICLTYVFRTAHREAMPALRLLESGMLIFWDILFFDRPFRSHISLSDTTGCKVARFWHKFSTAVTLYFRSTCRTAPYHNAWCSDSQSSTFGNFGKSRRYKSVGRLEHASQHTGGILNRDFFELGHHQPQIWPPASFRTSVSEAFNGTF